LGQFDFDLRSRQTFSRLDRLEKACLSPPDAQFGPVPVGNQLPLADRCAGQFGQGSRQVVDQKLALDFNPHRIVPSVKRVLTSFQSLVNANAPKEAGLAWVNGAR
jgi:hypothetical protein